MEFNKMSRIIIIVSLLFVTSALAAQQESPQILLDDRDILENNDYKHSMELLLRYTPAHGIEEVYLHGFATLLINKLYADNELLEHYCTHTHFERREAEIYSDYGTVTRKMGLIYIPLRDYWTLTIRPHGSRTNIEMYNIPGQTKVLDIYYHILYPTLQMSKEYHSRIVIRSGDRGGNNPFSTSKRVRQ